MNQKTVYHVEAHKKGWAVKKQGSDKPSKVLDEKNQAISTAHELLENKLPGEIVIHGRRGEILDRVEKEEVEDFQQGSETPA